MLGKFYFLFFYVVVLSGSLNAFSQSPWAKVYDVRFGGRQTDFLDDFIQTTDGGFLLAGYSLSGISGDKSQPSRGGNDYWVVKTDANGIKQWDVRFGGSMDDYLMSVEQTNDGGYILGGTSSSANNGDKTEPGRGLGDYWIVKLDSAGTKMWDKCFGGDDEEFLSKVTQTADGGFLVSGVSRSDSSGDKSQPTKGGYDFWIVRTDTAGNKIWDLDIGGTDDEQLKHAAQTRDGGFIFGGSSISGIGGNKSQPVWGSYDYWIVKTDSLGTILWDRDLGGSDLEQLESMQENSDGGFILGGFSLSGISGIKTKAGWGAQDYWVIKTDSLGNFLWDNDFGSYGTEDEVGSTFQTSDGGFLICGESQSPIGGDKTEANLGLSQAWIVKTDSAGTKEWEKTILTSPEQKLSPLAIQTINGCFAVAYASWAGISGYKTQPNWDTTFSSTDYWIITYCDSTGPPIALFNANQMLCPGTCTSFNNLSLFGSSYQWEFTGASVTFSNDTNPQDICYSTPGSYDVTLIATNSFGSDTLVFSNYITVYPFPPPQSITQHSDTLLALQGAQYYQWYFNGAIINGATDYYYVFTESGDYNVVCTDDNGCEVEAAIYDIIAGVTNNGLTSAAKIFPNPAKDELNFEFYPVSTGNLEISIYNSCGKIVRSCQYPVIKGKSNRITIDVSEFPSGLYLLKAGGLGNTCTAKIQVLHLE